MLQQDNNYYYYYYDHHHHHHLMANRCSPAYPIKNWRIMLGPKFYCLQILADGNQCIWIMQKMPEFSLTVSLAPSLYHRSTSPHYNRFTALFPGLPKSVGARRKLHLDFMVLGRITRGRHSDNPGGRHSIQTNQQCTSINPPFLCWMPFLPQPPIHPGLGQAQEYAGLHTPMACTTYQNNKNK